MTDSRKGAQLQLSRVRKEFAGKEVLKGVDLKIDRGEFVAIVGRSGCGKSTLLRLIAGLDLPTEGTLLLGSGEQQSGGTDIRVLFQEARLLPWKSVLDNVRIGTPGKDKAKATEALAQVGLADRAGEWPHVLSGGQKQRVALARGLASKPRLLLLDEPLGALDALTRIEMQQLIERLWLEQGFTVVLVTHDVSEAVALADRVILIEEGVISLDKRITLDRPRNRDSGFIYFENLILNKVLGKEEIPLQKKVNYTI
ncbi:aliphatic sulfonate ABC transporter ATP-binding protein [Paenibacillus sp. BIHB 4019]|uniref:Aliphatic sulfonate ABC transporter ATP-binding protein n=1 Tax=Paenibacillus sp. BIHB 4019 TaxID=1870819 RepID=A0A1B2DCV3_9BACL|nr:ATP-binding cassette domain-containing protein [Paenibacillus sp. BIHB 4019]ANY65538.1 aliphatic sulfonate ABC transporter ATP-binding protein [Paenibacillus sp. BIHB 4019]